MASSQTDHSLAPNYLGQIGSALILIFAVNSLFSLLPLQLFNPSWQLRIADTLRTTAPFPLLGSSLLFLSQLTSAKAKTSLLRLHHIQRFAPIAALGFLLLIPLQINATYQQINQAEIDTNKTLRSIVRRIDALKSAETNNNLIQLSQGLPESWQPLASTALETNRTKVLSRVEPELARISTLSKANKLQAMEKGTKDGLRDSLISAIYTVAFLGLRSTRKKKISSGVGLVMVNSPKEHNMENAWIP